MRIALIASPFLEVPPPLYGGTELFISDLATHLERLGASVVVYTVGTSTVPVEKRYLYLRSRWPLTGTVGERLRDARHSGWAMAEADKDCDIIHVNDATALSHLPLVHKPVVATIHHPFEPDLAIFYGYYPEVQFVAISRSQARRFRLPHIRVIHHGIDLSKYQFRGRKQPYLSFLGRLAPIKGPHLAIRAARRSGMKLKIAGEVQPPFRDYYEREIEPEIDGDSVQYVGEVDLERKNELVGNSKALLFPVLWEEPFGLVAVEAMACGTPVVALHGGAVAETVQNGVSGYVCHSMNELVKCARMACTKLEPRKVREHVEQHFSAERMARDYLALYESLLRRRGTRPRVERLRRAA